MNCSSSFVKDPCSVTFFAFQPRFVQKQVLLSSATIYETTEGTKNTKCHMVEKISFVIFVYFVVA
jgi:hypothetical protein